MANDSAGANEHFLVVDREFHALLVRRAENHRLSTMMASLRGQVSVFQVYGIHSPELLTLSIAHHQAILLALRQGDRTAAEAAMEHHIDEVKGHVLMRLSNVELGPVMIGR